MTTYFAPTRDMQFVINQLAGLDDVAQLPAFAEQEVSPELVEAILVEASKLAGEVLAPLNPLGAILFGTHVAIITWPTLLWLPDQKEIKASF